MIIEILISHFLRVPLAVTKKVKFSIISFHPWKDSSSDSARKANDAFLRYNDSKSEETSACCTQEPRQNIDQFQIQNRRQKHPEVYVHSWSAQGVLPGVITKWVARIKFHDFHIYLRENVAYCKISETAWIRFSSTVSLAISSHDYSSLLSHGQMSQQKRLGALARFKGKSRSILVCTDVASRGLDVPHVDCVINYDV